MLVLVLYCLFLTLALVRYSRYATRYINTLRADADELEQRFTRLEAAFTRLRERTGETGAGPEA